MKNREIERKLRMAVNHAAPQALEDSVSKGMGARAKGQQITGKRHRSRWMALAGAAAALLIVAGSLWGAGSYASYHRVDSIVAIDVNPSIELQVNGGEKVLEAKALNQDAERILDGMDLRNTDLNVAVNALIGSMLKNGYISDLANSILVSVENGDREKGQALQQKLVEEIGQLLHSNAIEGAILSQTLGGDEELKKMAGANQISAGRAALIQRLIDQNPLLQFDDLAKLTVNELNLLAEAQKADLQNIASTGTASDKAYIGQEKAKQLAYQHAGVQSADYTEIELDCDDGVMVYDVEFYANGREYDYEINARTGEVLEFKVESQNAGTPSGGSGDIGAEKAGQLALQNAGVKRADATGLRTETDREDGILVYEVEFVSGGVEYEYVIRASDGTILKAEKEGRNTQSSSNSQSAPSGGDIGREKATEIALQHAGVSSGSTTKLKAEQDHDDGVLVYEVEFVSGGVEYSYEIEAATGKILEWDSETDD